MRRVVVEIIIVTLRRRRTIVRRIDQRFFWFKLPLMTSPESYNFFLLVGEFCRRPSTRPKPTWSLSF